MRLHKRHAVVLVAVAAALAVVSYAIAGGGSRKFDENLQSYQEVPSVSSVAKGTFRAEISNDGDEIEYRLRYSDLEGAVTQAHIHLGQKDANGGISVFLCSNLGNGPPGTQACPPSPATVTGTLTADDVVGPAGQGIAPGGTAAEFAELVKAIKAGVTYANVHSAKFPNGEIRAQLGKGGGNDDDD
jgi:hypothetical protein